LTWNPIEVKAGFGRATAAPEYTDGDWRVVSLPHDWAIESPSTPSGLGSQGYYERGTSWYRKTFPFMKTRASSN